MKHPDDHRSCIPVSVEDLSLTCFPRPVVQSHEYRRPETLELSICCDQWSAYWPPIISWCFCTVCLLWSVVCLLTSHHQLIFLYSCFSHTVNELIAESGCMLEHPSAAQFRTNIMNGEWNKVNTCHYNLFGFFCWNKYILMCHFFW